MLSQEILKSLYNNFFLTKQHSLQGYMRILSKKCLFRSNEATKYNYSIHFVKGNDQRTLNISQQNSILDIVKEQKLTTSSLLYNSEESTRKIQNWKKELPWIHPHYAVKSNPHEHILKDLRQKGAKFDCASRSQMECILELGCNPADIVYSNSIKDESDLIWASRIGIKHTTADSIDQLLKIQQYAPNIEVLWRIAIKQEENDALATQFSGKFGDDIDNQEKIHQRMAEIAELGIKLKGVHFHCGSGHHGSSAFGKAITLARSCLEIGRKYGHVMTLMDIGGGFPNGDLSTKTIADLKVTENDPLGYQVISEPGRHFSGLSSYLLTRVLGKRLKNGKKCYHLNESLYHSFNCNIMDGVSFQNQQNQFYSSICSNKEEVSDILQTQNATLFGMTCDGMDVITKNIPVPRDLSVGDWICIGGMGAYTYGCRSNFNGMKSTQKVIRWGRQEQKVTKPESSLI